MTKQEILETEKKYPDLKSLGIDESLLVNHSGIKLDNSSFKTDDAFEKALIETAKGMNIDDLVEDYKSIYTQNKH